MISGLMRDLKYFWSKKVFAVGLIGMMALSYATLLLNPTVGIDDTAFKVYFVDGVAPVTGRWCLYLLQKVIPLNYNPYFIETLGLLCFCLSVSLWCVLFFRILGERVPIVGYTIFAGVMISCPMLSEIVVWYLQNGIYLAYGVTALALLVLLEAMREGRGRVELLKRAVLWIVLLTVAIGFYESFMVVFFMGALMIFVLLRATNDQRYQAKPFRFGMYVVLSGVFALVLRTVIVKILTMLFHLQSQYHILEDKGFGYIAESVKGWFDGSRAFGGVMQEFFVKYYIHGVVYLPVLILVLAVCIVAVWGALKAIGCRDGWIAAGVLGIILLPWSMPLLEGTATFYRASQYVPVLTAFSVLLALWEVRERKKNVFWYAGLLMSAVLLYRQGYEMNRWLLVDAMKYEDDKRAMCALALELQAGYDTSKPICAIGNRKTPESLLQDVYTPVWSKKYSLVRAMVKAVNEDVFEKYDTPYGYAAPETPQLSFVNWACHAFYGFDRELIAFWKMLGFTFVEDGDQGHYIQAEELMKTAPAWPQKGSIVEMDDHIIVNFGN